ncbi:hypothetical protein GKZ68_00340 [Hymenobacter sp. BRD128]|uniref:hypothetical protein n=1 Tax=Hymenobacter sp. BRD128 TaxID=2675878 RepID=UPI001566F0E2|nr:hypothetical protein [Hymenobacter sp. BRD128]QKG55220.1 hypothetical protein GKZ68_00340 [Hymenobacter sp. BRD128]
MYSPATLLPYRQYGWLLVGLTALGQPITAQAQALSALEQASTTRANVLALRAENRCMATPLTSAAISSLVSPFSQVAVVVKPDNQEASVALGYSTNYVKGSVTLRQPFQGKLRRVTPLSLDGLGQGASAVFNLQFNTSGTVDQAMATAIHNRLTPQVQAALAQRQAQMPAEQSLVAPVQTASVQNDAQAQAQLLKTADFKNFIGEEPYRKTALVGVTFSLGKVGYDYLATSLSQQPESLTGINRNLRLYAGYAMSQHLVFVASYTWQRHYETSTDDPITVYYPLTAGSSTLTSKDVFMGKPTLGTTGRLNVEARILPVNQEGRPFVALNPSVHLLTNGQQLAFNLGVYLQQTGEDGKLKGAQGGLAVGYLTGKRYEFQRFADGVSAEVFVSVPFNIFDFNN